MRVIFCRSNTLGSLLIRLLTWSRWSHCGVIIDNDVIHATIKNGVIRESLEFFKAKYKSHEIRTMRGDASKAIPTIGAKYDCGGVFGHWFGAWNSNKKWFCSELVANCSAEFAQDRLNRITPEHCFMISKPEKKGWRYE